MTATDKRERLILEGEQMAGRVERMKRTVAVGDKVRLIYGVRDNMNANYTKLRKSPPYYAYIEALYDNHFVCVHDCPKGKKVRWSFPYVDLVRKEIVERC